MRRGLAAFALMAVAAAACGKGATPAGLFAAADRVRKQGTARFEMTISFGGGLGGSDQRFETTARGVMDFAGQTGTMTLDFSNLFRGDVPKLPGFPERIDMVFTPTKIYMRFPGKESKLPKGKTWLSLDPTMFSGTLGGGGALGTSDPSRFLDILRGATKATDDLGEEKVRGVATRHFRAQVDILKTLAGVPKEGRDAIKTLLGGKESGTIPLDVWIDKDNLLRKMASSFEVSKHAVGFAFELYDYGTPVEVRVPKPSEVAPVTDPSTIPQFFGGD